MSVNDVLHNNGEKIIEWQPLALTLVEYPKGNLYSIAKKFFLRADC